MLHRVDFPFRRIVEYVSTFCTLLPGGPISAGAPTGAGARLDPPQWLREGDVAEATVESVGTLGEMRFRATEHTGNEESGSLWAVRMHRKGGVHDIAFTNGAGPRQHHITLWVQSPLHIIDLLDLMATTGYVANIERGPGRHGIANAFFPCVRNPTAIAWRSTAAIIRRRIPTTSRSGET
jgi:hypothetical protein